MSEVYIGEGSLIGRGVYAGRDFRAGEIVIRYTLLALTPDEFDALPKEEKMFTHHHGDTIHLYGVPERFVNHSPEPNTVQDFEQCGDIALRDIQKDEMITTDASKDDIS